MKWLKYINIGLMCVILMGCNDKSQHIEILPDSTKVLAFGDSVTYGYGVDSKYAYPSILSELSGWNVINVGINGERTDEGKRRIDDELTKYQPKVVIIELGGNDFLQNRDPIEVKEDLRSIIKQVKYHNSIALLVGVPTKSSMTSLMGKPVDSNIYSELADEEKIVLLPNVFSNVLADDALKQDIIHPNEEGYKVLAKGIYDAMKKQGF